MSSGFWLIVVGLAGFVAGQLGRPRQPDQRRNDAAEHARIELDALALMVSARGYPRSSQECAAQFLHRVLRRELPIRRIADESEWR